MIHYDLNLFYDINNLIVNMIKYRITTFHFIF